MQNHSMSVLSEQEWILTNGLGGYALSFGDMINKRKYNGLLIASTNLMRRTHILASIEEKLESRTNFFYLDASHYPNCIYPNGYKHIVKSWLRPYPCTIYSSVPAHENYMVCKEVFMLEKQNGVVVQYTNLGKKGFSLILRPKFTMRDHHLVNPPGLWDYTPLERDVATSSFKVKRPDIDVSAYGYIEKGSVIDDTVIFRSVYYPTEATRGYDSMEDLISPVRITMDIEPGQSSWVLVSSAPITEPIQAAERAIKKYRALTLPSDHPAKNTPLSVTKDVLSNRTQFEMAGYLSTLEMAATDFIAEEDIIAGYPWFGAWARDSMISMSGLKCLPEGKALALKILKKYGSHLNGGLLPNTFGEGGAGANYDSVDAPLWYILRCFEYAPQDKVLFANCCHIILHYLFENTHPFFVADDGLVEIRPGDHALTWMDAKIYNTPVTPRWGKPVEINALWYNALCAVRKMASDMKVRELTTATFKYSTEMLDTLINTVEKSLQKFVGADFLADRIEGDTPIWEIRPNAVIGLSLPFDFVKKDVLKQVWKTAKEKLLTPQGLRSLDPAHPAFKQKYIGNQKQRDMAYHQGTVWSFLMLPFVLLTIKACKDEMSETDLVKEISGYIWGLRNSFLKGEMASVAEVWDGVDAFFPKGCPAQAWSVFALLEIEQLLAQHRSVGK